MRPSVLSRLPSLFSYDDYRDYLRAVREAAGRQRPVPLTRWAKQLGYRSRRSVGMVLEGKRLPSSAMKERLASWLQFSPREMRYFELLVEKRRCELHGHAFDEIQAQLQRLNAARYRQEMLRADIVPFVSRWYHLVIKQLLAAPGAVGSVDWIFARLRGRVPRARIRESLARLCRLGFFRLDEATGRYVLLQGNVQTPPDVPNAAIRLHHRGMLARAIDSLREDPVERRELTTLTFRGRPADLEKMKKRIREFRESFDQEFEAEESGEVLQLNIQLFSHT